ncbi:Homeobox-leucine zipper protein ANTHOCYANINLESS 2 [Striga hermonthica]|uniref:Homeobox-leucine zipper protein ANTHOCYANINLESS 2 n=1 Tax=Striga hermonthica TaxID=68872 RepID=A0A9N7NKI9_STRHE|nr:Homeobox-leucine zipper protein ANTHOCYANINLESS 2 [Striga hermonthica]
MSAAAAAAISQPMSAAGKPMFNSPGLSLALQTGMEGGGQGDHQLGARNIGENGNYENIGGVNGVGRVRSRDELEVESRSGSDNMDAGSGDDHDGGSDKPPRKKRYHRHTPQQIQELEALFKECPHPDEKQRLELSRRLCLETRQVKFWFQNRRTQMKTQIERHENSILRQENDKLRAENMTIKDAMRNPICTNCGGPAMIGEISLEEQHLRIENARLKDELDRVCALAGKFLGRPISSLGPPIPSSSLELGVGSNGFGGLNMLSSTLPLGPGLGPSDFLGPLPPVMPHQGKSVVGMTPIERSLERPMYLELALAAMDELVKMAQTDEPVWIGGLEGGRDVLNREEYLRMFSPCIGMRPNGFVSEASRETGMVIINSLALVETLMDSNKWAEMFPCIIARTTTTDVISDGMGGTRNGALQLMHAELQVLSPLVPVREVNFLRFCKQHAEGVWAVVDVSIDTIIREASNGGPTYPSYRRLPSGCVVQDMPNGYSKVTWVEHSEYDESQVHHLYRSSIAAGLGFGARRWVATLQRQCECLAILMSSVPSRDPSAITAGGRRSMLKLAQRMTNNFCAGGMDSNQNSMLILQETCIDASGSLVVYAPVDIPAMHVVMNGGDSAYVALLPSGFSIAPDGQHGDGPSSDDGPPQAHRSSVGSLLTVAFQILVNSLPTAKLTVESVETVNNLISCTVQKIKAALQCDG